MKQGSFCASLGAIGGVIASAFGGWDAALSTLLIFMGIDYLTGLIVAGVFHRLNFHVNAFKHFERAKFFMQIFYRDKRFCYVSHFCHLLPISFRGVLKAVLK